MSMKDYSFLNRSIKTKPPTAKTTPSTPLKTLAPLSLDPTQATLQLSIDPIAKLNVVEPVARRYEVSLGADRTSLAEVCRLAKLNCHKHSY